MSALLVQTSNHMITVAKMMEEQGLDLPLLIGGAPVSTRHAAQVAMAGHEDPERMRSDVFYCRTAMDGVNVMNTLQSAADLTPFLEKNKTKLLNRLERAQQRESEEEALMASLPRRVVRFDGHHPADTPRFRNRRIDMDLRDFASHLDKRTLFTLNWRFGGAQAQARAGHSAEELEQLFGHWVTRASEEGWIRPQGVAGLFPCRAEGDELVLYHPENPESAIARIAFTAVIGGERKDIVSGAQYFLAEGGPDVVGLQLTTAGPQIDAVLETLRKENDSESSLFLQGLSDRVAEDMADYVHARMREWLGVDPAAGTRWSPGYPGMRDTAMNKVILEALDATALAGIAVTEAGEFSPTGTTAAVVSFHPDAKYT